MFEWLKGTVVSMVLRYLLPRASDWVESKVPELKEYVHEKLRDLLPDWSEDTAISVVDKVIDAGLALILAKLPEILPLYQSVLTSTGSEGQAALVAYESAVDKVSCEVSKLC